METLGVERITNESLNQEAQELLEDYYEKRNSLVEQIKTFQEALDTARADLRELNKKNRKLLKQTGNYKTYDEKVYNFILKNPGLLNKELKEKVKEDESLITYNETTILPNICKLLSMGLLRKEEGRFYANREFKAEKTQGVTDLVKAQLKIAPASSKEIFEFIKSTGKNYTHAAVNSTIYNLLKHNKVSSNQTYKGQNGVVFTWIGEN